MTDQPQKNTTPEDYVLLGLLVIIAGALLLQIKSHIQINELENLTFTTIKFSTTWIKWLNQIVFNPERIILPPLWEITMNVNINEGITISLNSFLP